MQKRTRYSLVGVAVFAAASSGLGIASASTSSSPASPTTDQAANAAVTTSEPFLAGQAKLDPPGIAASAPGQIAPSDALKLDSASMMGQQTDAATIQFGLYTNATQGTVDPTTGAITNLLHVKQPVYFVTHHRVTVRVGNGRTLNNETVVTIVDAQTGKWIGQFGQPQD
jgi:hypothetical protein